MAPTRKRIRSKKQKRNRNQKTKRRVVWGGGEKRRFNGINEITKRMTHTRIGSDNTTNIPARPARPARPAPPALNGDARPAPALNRAANNAVAAGRVVRLHPRNENKGEIYEQKYTSSTKREQDPSDIARFGIRQVQPNFVKVQNSFITPEK